DEAEDEHAAEYAEADQQNRDAGAAGDQDGFDEIVDAADDQKPVEHHEDRPAGLLLTPQPGGGPAPDQRRPDRDHRQEKGRKAEQHGARHAGNQKADHRHRPLGSRSADDAEHDADHRVVGLVEDFRAEVAAQLAGADVKRLVDFGAVAIEEEDHEQHQRQLQQAVGRN